MANLGEVVGISSPEVWRSEQPAGMQGIETKRVSRLTLVFAAISFVFFILLIFFRTEFPGYPLMSYQDVLDILTPLVLIPVYWLLFRFASLTTNSIQQEIVFMVLASVWVIGHGMHLAANSINNLASNLARGGGIDITGTQIYEFVYFFDETLSHYLWHIGVIGLAVLLIYREWRKPAGERTSWWYVVPAVVLYGFTLFALFLEGQTLALGLPFTLILVLFTLIWGRKKLSKQPILAFFFSSCMVAVLLFASWALYWGGLPQFSETGLI